MSMQVNDYVLLIMLALAVYFDLTRKKIPNYLTLPAIGWGLVSHTIIARFDGFMFSFIGLLIGLAIFLVPFAMGELGGGDVKMLGAVGALHGAAFVFHAALFTAICGGVIALVYLLAGGKLLFVLRKMLRFIVCGLSNIFTLRFGHPMFVKDKTDGNFRVPSEDIKAQSPTVPYGVAIALGTIFALSGLVIYF